MKEKQGNDEHEMLGYPSPWRAGGRWAGELPSEGLVVMLLLNLGGRFLSELYVSVLLYVWYLLIKFQVKKKGKVSVLGSAYNKIDV